MKGLSCYPGQDTYGIDFTTGQTSAITDVDKLLTYKYTENICTLHFILSFAKSSRFNCSVSPGWLVGVQKPFTQGDPASKPLRMDERREISGASCPQPFDLSHVSPLGSGQVRRDGPEPAPLCLRGSWHRKRVVPGKENLPWMPGEQNEMTPGRMRRSTADLGVTLQSQGLKG